jgi:hypothetical protein
MKAKSFDMVVGCHLELSTDDWNWQVPPAAYDDPTCYQPVGTAAWVATNLSAM